MSKSKVPYEEKVRIVKSYLNGQSGYVECVKEANNSEASFRQWVAQYNAGGPSALLPTERNKSYPAELKERAVKEYLSGPESLESICLKYQVRSITQLRRWIKVYNAHGDFNSAKHSGGGSYMREARSTTQEERIRIAKGCIASGRNYGEMAIKYEVSYQQVRTWTLRFEEMGGAGLQDRRGQRKKDQIPRTELEQAQIEIKQLKHKLYLAEMETALLKKIRRGGEEGFLSQVRQSHIYIAIKECQTEAGYPIEVACKLLHVARSAYNKWASGKLSHRVAENEQIAKYKISYKQR